MGWLKEKYKEIVLNFFLTIIGMFLIFWATGIKDSDANIKKDIEDLKLRKAPYEYVDKQNDIQDQRMETVRKENREDHSMMIQKLDEIIKTQKR